jgi:hypothetical protein
MPLLRLASCLKAMTHNQHLRMTAIIISRPNRFLLLLLL